MNREIKFRVWSKEINAFVYLDLTKEKAIDFAYGESETLEQFTGETDKNGVDIYENDIVKLWWKHKTWIEPVVFDCGGFYPFTDTCGQYADPWEVSAICHTNYEVIGNIHEHKHLLED